MATILEFSPNKSPGSDYHPYEYLQHRFDLTPEQIEKRRQQWMRDAYGEGKRWLRDSEEAQAQGKYISYLLGKQWEKGRPSYKSSPVNNILLRIHEKTIALLTDIRPAYEVTTSNDIYQDQAQKLTKRTKHWWINRKVDFSLAMAVTHAFLSTGYVRIVRNNRAGEFDLQPIGIGEILPIGPPVLDMQEWEGMIYDSVRPLAWFRRKFPTQGWKVKASPEYSRYPMQSDRPGHIPNAAWDLMSEQMRRVVGGPQQFADSVVPMAPYREFWVKDYSINTSNKPVKMGIHNWTYMVKPGNELYPRGRLMIAGGDDFQCMDDTPNYHWHGRWPYVAFRLKPFPFHFHGISELRTKIPMQDIINHIVAGILDMIKKAINPALVYPSNAFAPNVIKGIDPSMPNLKLGYNQAAAGKPPEWSKPPELPAYVPNMVQYFHNESQDDSGLLDITGLAKKKVTPAGDTLDSLRESQQTVMRLRGRYISNPIREIGEQMVPNFLQFDTLRKRMAILGKDGVTFEDVFDYEPHTMVPAGSNPWEYILNYAFQIAESSLLNVNQTENKLQAFALRERGDFSRKKLFQALDIASQYDENERELEEEAQKAMQMAAPMAGSTTPHFGGKGSDNPQNLLKQK